MPRIELHRTETAGHHVAYPKPSRRENRNYHPDHISASFTQQSGDIKKGREGGLEDSLSATHSSRRRQFEALSATTPRPKNKKDKRKVSFNPLVAVRSALHRNDYTDKEFQAVWYSPEETGRILDEAKIIVKKMNKGYALSDMESMAARGLECRTILENAKRMDMRASARTVVCQEQERHWEEGIQDTEMLALAYSGVASQALVEARRRGRLDEFTAAMMA